MVNNQILPLQYKNSIYKEVRTICIQQLNVSENLELIQEETLSEMILYYYQTLDKLKIEEEANKYFLSTYKHKIMTYLWKSFKYQHYTKEPKNISLVSIEEDINETQKIKDVLSIEEEKDNYLRDVLFDEIYNIRFDIPKKYDLLKEMLTIYLDEMAINKHHSYKGLMDFDYLSTKYDIHPGVIKNMWSKYKNHLIKKYKNISKICV